MNIIAGKKKNLTSYNIPTLAPQGAGSLHPSNFIHLINQFIN